MLRALSLRDGPHLRRWLAKGPPTPSVRGWVSLWLWTQRTLTPAYVVLLRSRRIGLIGLYDLELGLAGKLSLILGRCRRQGYGTRAVRLLRQSLAQHDVVRELLAEVELPNPEAIAFLRSVGFEDAGVLKGHRLLRCSVGGR